ncbi:hypothetical protein RISK_004000 [Rhodopirellula islandica]|uniref:Uncharacterized protein n=1 Tax=Rhodopirellula islandica TaxID=595434 RepID=A0A0J1BBZ4_RHOIS|nr:hypothetical protein RISK_004000 [Rhodopirellula islandica]
MRAAQIDFGGANERVGLHIESSRDSCFYRQLWGGKKVYAGCKGWQIAVKRLLRWILATTGCNL